MRRQRRLQGQWLVALALACVSSGCHQDEYAERFERGEIDLYDDLYAATAVGPDHLWAAGYFGAIYRTTDGGKHFTKLDTPTEKSIYDIDFADEKSGWAVGRRGFIIHTRDGGDTWQKQAFPRHPPQHIFSVSAIDADTAWAIGEWGGRYYTADGGETWQDRSFLMDETHPAFEYLTDFELERYEAGEKLFDDIYLNDVFFLDAEHGWMVGEYGFIWRTDDAGETWERGRIQGDLAFDDLLFEPFDEKVARSDWEMLFAAAEVLQQRPYLKVKIEAFLTQEELRKTGDTFLADERASSVQEFLEDEGITQDRLKMVNPTPYDQESVDMEAFTKKKIAARPRVKIEVMETPFLFDVKFKDEMNGVIAGLGGVILLTTDGGRTWKYAPVDSYQAFFSVGLGGEALVAVGEKGQARLSRDQGARFEKPAPGSFPESFGYFRDAVFGTPEHGWIVGHAGNILRSSDGGLSWSRVLPHEDGVSGQGVGE